MAVDEKEPEVELTPVGARRVHLHHAFDRLWKSGAMTRTQAYRWLATVMRLTLEECHIANFTAEQIAEASQHVRGLPSWTTWKPREGEA